MGVISQFWKYYLTHFSGIISKTDGIFYCMYVIRTISSPSHKIRFKKTAAKAVVEMEKNQSVGDGFQLLVGLAEIHMPRMWVERQNDSQVHLFIAV